MIQCIALLTNQQPKKGFNNVSFSLELMKGVRWYWTLILGVYPFLPHFEDWYLFHNRIIITWLIHSSRPSKWWVTLLCTFKLKKNHIFRGSPLLTPFWGVNTDFRSIVYFKKIMYSSKPTKWWVTLVCSSKLIKFL